MTTNILLVAIAFLLLFGFLAVLHVLVFMLCPQGAIRHCQDRAGKHEKVEIRNALGDSCCDLRRLADEIVDDGEPL